MKTIFRSLDEQIGILLERGMVIEDIESAKTVLSRVNYYTLINGYKSIFLQRDKENNIFYPEKYIDGVKFDEIFSLYQLDQDLKRCFFKYILMFEKLLKTSCAYHFSDRYRDENAYLQLKNYSNDVNNAQTVLKNISTLANIITGNLNNSNKPQLRYYLENYGEIPLWVLINNLTLGNLSYFFNSLEVSLQSRIARDFSKAFKTDYNILERVDENDIKEALKISIFYRNIIAHDEVMFTFEIKKSSPYKGYQSMLGYPYFGKSLFDLFLILKLVIPRVDYEIMEKEVKVIFKNIRHNFHSVNFLTVLRYAGFDKFTTLLEDI